MRKVVVLAIVALILGAGCKSKRYDREFIPGKGWKPVNRAPAI